MSPSTVGIIGAVEHFPDGSAPNLEETIFRACTAALRESELERRELDAIVISASDQTDGRAISSMLTGGAAGAHLKDEINVASSPGHAFVMACLSILSGQHQRVLLSTWGCASEASAEGGTEAAERLAFDPSFERHAMSNIAAMAMQALVQRGRARGDEGARAVAARSRRNAGADAAAGAARVLAHPLREAEVAVERDGAFAVVLTASDAATRDDAIWVHGFGWRSDSSRIGERDLAGLPHLRAATSDATNRANLTRGATAVDVLELHDYSADAELLACEAIGLCSSGTAPVLSLDGEFDRDGPFPVNAAGGSLAGEAPHGGALRKVISAVRQLRGEAADAQIDGASSALVQMASGAAGQFQTVVVLRSER